MLNKVDKACVQCQSSKSFSNLLTFYFYHFSAQILVCVEFKVQILLTLT